MGAGKMNNTGHVEKNLYYACLLQLACKYSSKFADASIESLQKQFPAASIKQLENAIKIAREYRK